MKHFPYRILFVCIFFPPVCYIFTLQVLEGYFQRQEIAQLNRLLIQHYDALYEGQYTVKEEVSRNISDYLSRDIKFRVGVTSQILVKTRDDRILYPAQFGGQAGGEYSELQSRSLNFVEVAQENYRILNEGLILSVAVQIRHNSWLSNSILLIYVFTSLLILLRFVKKGIREFEKEEREQKEIIEDLSERLRVEESRLKQVESKEEVYLQKIARLNKEKKDLSRDVDEFLEEVEQLEEGLKDQRSLKEELEREVARLRDELGQVKDRLHRPRQKKKQVEAVAKRFKVLYKNLTFTERAIEGFLSLTDEFQLKAEEVIHKLNEGASQVSVKRKVFGRGGKMNVLETQFSYSGRIYFQKDSRPKTRVLAIGTKNTQDQDLAFIERAKE